MQFSFAMNTEYMNCDVTSNDDYSDFYDKNSLFKCFHDKVIARNVNVIKFIMIVEK